ncbi:MAG TPA: hypothetical protein VL860_09730 [Planctomycetota bacterium]|nr:hypothetical protein [Planctomycetota bacterium]
MSTARVWMAAAGLVCLGLVSFTAAAQAGDEAATIQDFEKQFPFTPWPETGKAEFSGDYHSDGKQSLLIHKGTMIAFDELALKDWSAYQELRLHIKAPADKGVVIGFEIADDVGGYLNRHQNMRSAPPGESVVKLDIGGGLWRGEVNHPNRADKSNIHLNKITRLAVTANDADVYIDQIELVKVPKLETAGGFAFDFGRKGGAVQSQWIEIDPTMRWDNAKGYGLSGGPRAFGSSSPFPTPVLGDGIRMFDGRFEVKLPAGKYIGWVAFERSGFWEGEQAVYSHAALLVNGKVVHEHTVPKATPWFELEDSEILTQEDIADKMVMRRVKTADFAFDAIDDRNAFTVQCDGSDDAGQVRLGGLVLAPDTDAGRAFIAAHKKLQRDTILETQRLLDKSVKLSDPAKATETLLILPEPTDYEMHPGDWPVQTASAPLPAMQAFAGTTAHRVVGLFATQPFDVRWTLSALKNGDVELPAAGCSVQVCRFMPQRDYDGSACWLAAQHYWPQPKTKVGPGLGRTLLVSVELPADTKPGTYTGSLSIAAVPENTKALAVPHEVAISVVVHGGSLPRIGMPAGLFFSGVPVPKELIGDEMYWKMTEEMLKQLDAGGRTMVTGGPNWSVTWNGDTPVWSGDDCLKLLALAHKYGVDQKIVNYGGFDTGLRDFQAHGKMSKEETGAALFKAWEEFRKKNNIPEEYIYSYDEPGTPDDFAPVATRLAALKKAGFKTIGFTSVEDPKAANENHQMLMKDTWAPAFNLHSEETLKYTKALGNEPWVYNNGLSRYHEGIHLWRNHRAGAGGRVDWIAAIIQGFQYDTLDSREIDPSCFFFHSKFGVMVTPKFMGVCEGGFDARLLWELERRAQAKAGTPAAAKIEALFKELEAQPYKKPIAWDAMETLRTKMIALMEETQ